jgi:hypothetical protein
MLRIISSTLKKKAQSFLDEIGDVDWGDDQRPAGAITDDNLEQYLVDDRDDEGFEEIGTDQPLIYDYREELPLGRPEYGVPEEAEEIDYADPEELVTDGINNAEVISFEYTDRHGNYAGTRTVEPHYTFIAATTGNEVLVTFDLSRSDIRAFIVGNIHPNGVRYEGVTFDPRGEIMRGVY